MLSIAFCTDSTDSNSSFQRKFELELTKQKIDAKIIITTNNQQEIERLIKTKEIDFLFIDTDFKDQKLNGLEFAKKLRKHNKDFYLVFLSNQVKYLYPSLSTKIFDYLIKPVNPLIIADFVTRIKDEFFQNNKLFININKWQSVKTSEIIYMEKSINKTIITTNKGSISCTKTLDTMQNSLPKNFARCHRCFIINKDKILSVNKKEKEVYLSNDIICPINSKFEI